MDGGNLQNFAFQFDPGTGNLLDRSGYLSGAETFAYDSLGRLNTINIGQDSRSITFATNGNITHIDEVGSLMYSIRPGDDPYKVILFRPVSGVPDHRTRFATYNSFDRPATISEGGYSASITYNADGERVKTVVTGVDGPEQNQYYVGGRYEYDSIYGPMERLYLGGDAYSAPMVLMKIGIGATSWAPYLIGRDYLGSITEVKEVGGNGTTWHYRYDPWGRLVDPSTGVPYASGAEPTLVLSRGYTGHEHLPWFGLINANARLYDPLIGRFLSPDPYVQDPDFTQNYNRYSYCLNNPLKYTDEDGEMWTGLTAMVMFPIALFKGIVKPIGQAISGNWSGAKNSFSQAWSEYGNKVANSAKIDWGLVETDKSLSLVERYLTVLSRFSWELPQTFLGNTLSHVRNIFSDVSVEYYNGATLVNSNNPSPEVSGMTLGSYIQGINLKADPLKNPTFAHEYGHTIQSRILGPLYIPLVAPPSLIGCGLSEMGHDHHNEWYEVWANNLSVDYFNNIGRSDVATKMQTIFPIDFTPDSYFVNTLIYYSCLFSLFL